MTDSTYISVIEHIHIEKDLGEGINIIPNENNSGHPTIKLTNNRDIINSLLTPQLKALIGLIEYENFCKPNVIVAYSKSQFDETQTNPLTLLDLNFYLVRMFFLCLWLEKDNSIDFNLGYLYFINKDSSIAVSSNVFSSSNFTCRGNREMATFSIEEIQKATLTLKENITIKEQNHKVGNVNSLGRIGIAIYFIQHARSCCDLGLKMTSYCSALETLFSNDSTELSHKLSERVARFLSNNPKDRMEIFKQIKNAYTIRSKVVHGSTFKPAKAQEIETQIIEIDNICRQIIKSTLLTNAKDNVFEWPNENHENYFLELLMS